MEKDITEKQLEFYPDIAADIVNGICFNGRQEIKAEDIQIYPGNEIIMDASGKHRERMRDVLYQIKLLDICVAYVGVENQSDVDNTMPLRVMGMNLGNYMRQVRGYQSENRKKNALPVTRQIYDHQKLIPVVNLVLNFGKPWDGPKSLWDMLDEEKREYMSDYITDYPIHIIDFRGNPGLYQNFHSDFRLLAQYLDAKGDRGRMEELRRNNQKIIHLTEFLDVMNALGYDKRYLKMKEEFADKGKEDVTMCELLDMCMEEGLEKGMRQGIERGARGIIHTALSFGASKDAISDILQQELCLSLMEAEKLMEEYGAS